MIKKLTLILFICFTSYFSQAAHLVGGELSFECVGNNDFIFNLAIYRDVPALGAGNDDQQSTVFIYNLDVPSANPTVITLNQTNVNGTGVPPNTINCVGVSPPNIQTNLKRYRSAAINLPLNANGYRAVYQRCCRNVNTINIPTVGGAGQGSTYEIFITRSALQNCAGAAALPILEFAASPPVRFCIGTSETIDQSVDPSILGLVDSVVYFLCSPSGGASGTCPNPNGDGTAGCPAFPFNTGNITYNPGYNAFQPLGVQSTITINSSTGELFVLPRGPNQGLFVVNICATAYLNGSIYSNISRDLQYSIFDCGDNDAGVPEVAGGQDNVGGTTNTDTSYILYCADLEINFSQESPQATTYFWDFGLAGVDSDTSIIANPTFTYPDVGSYLVTFIMNKGEPCVDTSYGVIQIFPSLNADFVFDAACFTIPVEFTDSTISTLTGNEITDWQWDFGDGSPFSSDINPVHQYSSAGTFEVELEVETVLGCIDTYSTSVTTLPSPQADFENIIACTGSGHQFNNTSSLNGTVLDSYIWDFGDGNGLTNSTTDLQPSAQIYTAPGAYDIILVASSTSGCSDTVRQVLTVAETAIADFSFSPNQICPGQPVVFTNTTTETFESFQWTIDGNIVTDNNPTFTYNTPGSQDVTLIIYSNTICGDTITKSVLIENGPIADFMVDSTCTNLDYTFQNNSIDNGFTIDEYLWDFGDVSTGTGIAPTHQYANVGDYTVELVVSSSLAICSDTATKIISVKENITPDFTYEPDTICANITPVIFTNTSTGSSWDNVSWDFGNDSVTSFDNPTNIYPEAGDYTVNLSIVDDICGEFMIEKVVEVLTVPDPNIPDTANICDGVLFPLTVSNDLGFDIVWSTGQTSTSIQIDNSIDTVIVVANNNGCIVSDTTFVTRDCPAYVPNSFTPNNDGLNDEFLPLTNNITSFTLTVYDRWGALVFETSSFDRGWRGFYDDGSIAPLDTYSYILQGIGLDEKVLFQPGIVNLIR